MENEKDVAYIPYYVAEAMADRQNMIIKRLWGLCLLLIILLVMTNGMWIWYESQFEYVETTEQEVQQDIDTGDGDATIIGIGDNYGESKTDR